MAKLFKTISLEDRWKDSIYSRSPITPSTKDQGDIQLKQTPNAAEKNSAILKSLAGADKINTIPTIVPIIPKSNLAVPFANVKFNFRFADYRQNSLSMLKTCSIWLL